MPALAANAVPTLPPAARAKTRNRSKSQITHDVSALLQLKHLNATRSLDNITMSGPSGLSTPLRPLCRRQRITHSSRKHSASFACAAAVNAICSASGQTQTVTRESRTITKAPVKEPTKTPDLDDGGPGLPPRDDGGGGGGGGGGGNWSGGFFLFGFLAFLGFLKDKESEEDYRDHRR